MKYPGRTNNPVQATVEETCTVSSGSLPTASRPRNFRTLATSLVSVGAWPSLRVLFRLVGLPLLTLATLGSIFAEAQNFAYVVNQGSDSVSVIDTSKNSVLTTIPVGSFPQGVAVTPDGTHAYVANVSDSVSVIDTSTNIVSATVPLPAGSEPIAVAISPDGTRAYVASCGTSSVSVISTSTNGVVATVSTAPLGACPYGVAVAPAGTRLYVPDIDSSTVSVIDTSNNTLAATIQLPSGSFPVGVGITPDGGHVYVADSGSGTVSVIDTSTNGVTKNITDPSLAGPYGVAVTPDGRHVYVSDAANNVVSEIDTSTNTVVAQVANLSVPIGLAIKPDGTRLYVTNDSFAGTVSVIDTSSNSLVAPVTVESYPQSVAIQSVQAATAFPFSAFSVKLEVFGQYHKKSGDGDAHGQRHDSSDDHEKRVALRSGADLQGSGFELKGGFSLAASSPGIDPVNQPVALQVGSFSTTIPTGSFRRNPRGQFMFEGTLNGVNLDAQIAVLGLSEHGFNYALRVEAKRASLSGIPGTVSVQLQIGPNTGKTTATVGAGGD
jgi:YVTN family beta-propeller protein